MISKYKFSAFLIFVVVGSVFMIMYQDFKSKKFGFQMGNLNSEKVKQTNPPKSEKAPSMRKTQTSERRKAKEDRLQAKEYFSEEKAEKKKKDKAPKKKIKPKRILFWNDFYGSKNFGFCCGSNPFKKAGCLVHNCQTTKSRNESLADIDAVVFHQRTIDKGDLPAHRFSWQRYVFLSLESPSYQEEIQYSYWNHFFNITMTYREDSDIFMPYGEVVTRNRATSPAVHLAGSKILKGKTGLIAWFVSHCRTTSRREDLVEVLKLHLPKDSVTIYGSCGSKQCREKDACWNMVGRQFKFYLSLENSICKDYVTEKLFDALKQNVVPIVLGGADYSSILPPDSYIDMADFQSMKELGEYLLYLDENESEYLKYFAWKANFQVLNDKDHRNQAFCRLCEFLHQNQEEQVIENLEDWWTTKSQCKPTL